MINLMFSHLNQFFSFDLSVNSKGERLLLDAFEISFYDFEKKYTLDNFEIILGCCDDVKIFHQNIT